MPERKHKSAQLEPVVAGVRITHPDKLMFPELGLTKLDIAKYYESVSRLMLAHLRGRPLTLVFCPTGVGEGCTYLRHSKVWGPRTIRRVKIQEKTKVGEYMVVDTAAGLISLIQMGVLEIHTWNTCVDHVEQPDRVVLDLDPGSKVTWAQVVTAARLVRKLLRAVGLESFPKTTGGRGLHVVVPLIPSADWSACLEVARSVALTLEQHDPALYTTAFAKAGRERKILIDYLRNNRTNTSVAAYSTRARAGATVSAPLSWKELTPSSKPGAFTVQTIIARLARRKDPWAEYWKVKQKLPRSSA